MESFEIVAMIAALALMSAAVAAKVLAAQLVGRMRHQVGQVAQMKADALGRLKMVQNQKTLGEQNKTALVARRNKLSKKMERLRQEIGDLREQEEVRRQRTEMRKVE